MTDEIMYRVMELSGQEYVDMYATKRKAERAEGGRRATVTKLPGQRAS
jgi:1-acyl-sn-glycerol-3-phosphate acyltransferase